MVDFTSEHPNLNNFGTLGSWGLKFSRIDHFNTIYKWTNEQNLRRKGVMP